MFYSKIKEQKNIQLKSNEKLSMESTKNSKTNKNLSEVGTVFVGTGWVTGPGSGQGGPGVQGCGVDLP